MNLDIYNRCASPNLLAYGLALSLLILSACASNSHPEVSMSDLSSMENDLRAIEAINQRDVQFALAGDSAGMMSQWTDDIVLLPSAGAILRGRSVIAEVLGGGESPEILGYVLDIQEVKVLGDHAYQWGTYQYTLRPRKGAETVRTSGKLMRILQRQPEGSWKIYRGIVTVDPPTP
jgi:uncharacterized protein (TIGR02246 family)